MTAPPETPWIVSLKTSDMSVNDRFITGAMVKDPRLGPMAATT